MIPLWKSPIKLPVELPVESPIKLPVELAPLEALDVSALAGSKHRPG